MTDTNGTPTVEHRLEVLEAEMRGMLDQFQKLAESTLKTDQLLAREIEKYKADARKLGTINAEFVRVIEKRVNELRDEVRTLQRGYE